MIPQSKGKMYLAAERGHTETDAYRSYRTFSFGAYQQADKTPFGPLYGLNNDTLGGGNQISFTASQPTDFILIPTVGAVMYQDSAGSEEQIEAGLALRVSIAAGTTVTLQNPYADELVNFIHIWIGMPELGKSGKPDLFGFDLEHNANQLIRLFPGSNGATQVYIAKLEGRAEVHFPLNGSGLFCYVIEGAFEIQYRLLEAGDSLALWDVEEAEMEALSNGAIVLLLSLQR
jgi:quercetin 2,3-dioxygenase